MLLDAKEKTLDTRLVTRLFGLMQEFLQEENLDVEIACLSERSGDIPELLLPPLDFFGRQAVIEDGQPGSQSSRRHPHVMDGIEIVALPDTIHVLSQFVKVGNQGRCAKKTK